MVQSFLELAFPRVLPWAETGERLRRYSAAYFEKYFATVAGAGFFVASETTTINNADTSTIGTTGMKPNTAVPPDVRDSASMPPTVQTTNGGPGAGAGTAC
jgi:hypothetical protein